MGLDCFFERNKVVGYFRKVNFLVKYFEDCGLEIENQKPVYIEEEFIKDLIEKCKEVLDNHNKAKELLPTTSGFFFGNTDYDESYFNDVQKVLKYCEETLLPMFYDLGVGEGIYFNIWY